MKGVPVQITDSAHCFICGKTPADTVISCPFFHSCECYLGWSILAGAKDKSLVGSMGKIPSTCQLPDIVTTFPTHEDFSIDFLEEEATTQKEMDCLLEEALSLRDVAHSRSFLR